MSTLALIMSITNQEKNNSSKVINYVTSVLYLSGIVVAVYLALQDKANVDSMTLKVWMLLLAVMEPWLFIVLHGISSHLEGVSFWTGAHLQNYVNEVTPQMFQGKSPMEVVTPTVTNSSSLSSPIQTLRNLRNKS